MEFPFYRGNRPEPVPDGYEKLPKSPRLGHTRPDRYIADEGLLDAVNVALLLNQPLLLTGEPGTGKTQLAYNVAWELGFGAPFKFETKSTSVARDLFYVYDALGRFHKDRESSRAEDYITFNALGTAILRTRERAFAARYLPEALVPAKPQRSVVLIDEIDKAPRDFPNDVLNEIEGLYFVVPELSNLEVRADQESPPVIIITSNSEKHLPDAFLRRCVYYHIPFPDKDALVRIVTARMGQGLDIESAFLSDALDLFFELRKRSSQIHKKPSTAELLGWLIALRRMSDGDHQTSLREMKEDQVIGSIATLIKTSDDRDAAVSTVKRWLARDGNGDTQIAD